MVDAKYYKMFLIGSNVLLLFVGLAVLILGVKMKWALSMLLLIDIPIILDSVNAIIATGVLISIGGVTGIIGACSESVFPIIGHLISLGIIVVMEFSVGVTLMIVKKTVSMAVDSPDCNNVCAASIDAAILDYALPSVGLMMTIIFVEALMIHSSIKLYFYVRDNPKVPLLQPAFSVQNVPMHNVSESRSPYVSTPQRQYASQFDYSPSHLEQNYVQHALGQPSTPSHHQIEEDKPPDYSSLHPPPMYSDSSQSAVGTSEITEASAMDESFNQV